VYISAVLPVLILVIILVLPVFDIFLELNYYINIEVLKYTPYKRCAETLEYTSIAVIIIYALYPAVLSSKKYFNRQNFGSLVVEYDFLKQLICIEIPVLVLVILVFSLTFGQKNLGDSGCYELNTNEFKSSKPICYLYTVFPLLTLMVSSSIVRFFSNISKKDFRYYYARGCFQVSKNQSESEKMTYLIRAINSYNKYLKRNLKLQISDINRISSKIISDSALEHYDFINFRCVSKR
jgi:hypothetical protein